MDRSRLPLLAGVAGPAAFVGAWALGGALRTGYSPVEQTISRLAEQGSSDRGVMTAGFVAFGALVPVFATRLQPRALRLSATTSGLATLAVALTPLTPDGGTTLDALHYVSAAVGYAGQAASPLVGASALPHPAVSRTVGALAGASLVASLVDSDRAGLWQRLGLGLVDAWFAVLALRLLQTGSRA
ncbi:MAG: rane protein [Frankiales bacterium]|nr:rane protein [Frankiales bacterium]